MKFSSTCSSRYINHCPDKGKFSNIILINQHSTYPFAQLFNRAKHSWNATTQLHRNYQFVLKWKLIQYFETSKSANHSKIFFGFQKYPPTKNENLNNKIFNPDIN